MKDLQNNFAMDIKYVGRKLIFLTLLIPFLLTSCDDQRVQVIEWVEYEPVYMSQEEFENAVDMEPARELEKPGKIYFYDQMLFVNEVNKGVHIIDNSDPSVPVNLGFINIPANKDIAVKGDLLYADSYSDLLVFDIGNIQQPELLSRVEGVFEEYVDFITFQRGFPYQSVDPSKGIVVDWKEVKMEEICEDNCSSFRPGNNRWVTFETSVATSFSDGGGASASGIGGSMARFAITGDYLYAVDYSNLHTFNISISEPVNENSIHIGWLIETVFPYKDHLYVGSANAMYIYDIGSDPSAPSELSTYSHFTACDPVVVSGDIAYVTLRDGERCPRGVNRLEVINVSDPVNPEKMADYEMINPHGLGIDGDYLFISEGDKGLKIMDAGNPTNIKQLRHIEDIRTFDVIPFNNVLMITGKSGIVQYDYSDINNLEHLSTIPIIND